MTQDSHTFLTRSCELLAFGEPTHAEPAFGLVRNELFAQLAGHGFRSIALETDRVGALAVNDFVQGDGTTLDAAMKGFSHGWGDLDANRQLVAWMREYNRRRPAAERLVFHGFDAPTETMSAPSPRRYLEHARDYLSPDHDTDTGLDTDIAGLAGDDERWHRTEAVMDPAMSPGATAEAGRLRVIADDLLTALYGRAPELIAATSRDAWLRARTHLTAGLGLLRYHAQSARPLERNTRISVLSDVRDALMARNLLEIREIEARRGPTFVFSHNRHLQRNAGWCSAGAVVSALLDDRYTFVAGSLGRSDAIGLSDPEPDTYEGVLQSRITTWAMVPATAVITARTRTDTTPRQGYFPLDQALLDGADHRPPLTGVTSR
jgi:erythromycin esterase-like protein